MSFFCGQIPAPFWDSCKYAAIKSARIRQIPQPPASLLLLVRPGGRTLHTTEQYAP